MLGQGKEGPSAPEKRFEWARQEGERLGKGGEGGGGGEVVFGE